MTVCVSELSNGYILLFKRYRAPEVLLQSSTYTPAIGMQNSFFTKILVMILQGVTQNVVRLSFRYNILVCYDLGQLLGLALGVACIIEEMKSASRRLFGLVNFEGF